MVTIYFFFHVCSFDRCVTMRFPFSRRVFGISRQIPSRTQTAVATITTNTGMHTLHANT